MIQKLPTRFQSNIVSLIRGCGFRHIRFLNTVKREVLEKEKEKESKVKSVPLNLNLT